MIVVEYLLNIVWKITTKLFSIQTGGIALTASKDTKKLTFEGEKLFIGIDTHKKNPQG